MAGKSTKEMRYKHSQYPSQTATSVALQEAEKKKKKTNDISYLLIFPIPKSPS